MCVWVRTLIQIFSFSVIKLGSTIRVWIGTRVRRRNPNQLPRWNDGFVPYSKIRAIKLKTVLMKQDVTTDQSPCDY